MRAIVVLLAVVFYNTIPKISLSAWSQASWSPLSELPFLPRTTCSPHHLSIQTFLILPALNPKCLSMH